MVVHICECVSIHVYISVCVLSGHSYFCSSAIVCVCVDEGLVEGWAKLYNGQLKRTILLFSN